MSIFYKKHKTKRRGFTLVESLIAITILMISVVAPIKLANDGVVYSTISEQEIIAYYLAQDGIEYIINRKMGNRVRSDNMLNGLDQCVISGGKYGCVVDSANNLNAVLEECLNQTCDTKGKMFYHSNGGYYDHSPNNGGAPSIYKRYIKIFIEQSHDGRVNAFRVESIVNWIDAFGDEREYKLMTRLFAW